MNPNSDLYSLIQKYEATFTKSEQKAANYVLQNDHNVLNMSITNLAEQCDVGEATVFRFCKTLNLGGYQNFKMLLAQSSVEKETVITLSDKVAINDSANEVFSKLLECSVQALTETYHLLHPSGIVQAVTYLSEARLIHFFGVGSSGVTALEAKNKFCQILPNVCFIEDGHMQAMTAALLSPADLAVAFSYSGSTKDTIEVFMGSMAPYGYRAFKLPSEKGNSLRIEPEEAKVVQMIFEMYGKLVLKKVTVYRSQADELSIRLYPNLPQVDSNQCAGKTA